jgi:hypothetical protein
MKTNTDIDIDFGNKESILAIIDHVPASIRNVNPIRKHPSGVYVTRIPVDPINGMSSIHYEDAEKRGYFKLDMLNVHVYNLVRDEKHLIEMMYTEPNWKRLREKSFVEQLVHLNNQYYNIQKMPEPIDSIPRLAMFLAVIRPAKRHLIGLPWKKLNEKVWEKDEDGYQFKKSHACAYANLIVVHMNLLEEQNDV